MSSAKKEEALSNAEQARSLSTTSTAKKDETEGTEADMGRNSQAGATLALDISSQSVDAEKGGGGNSEAASPYQAESRTGTLPCASLPLTAEANECKKMAAAAADLDGDAKTAARLAIDISAKSADLGSDTKTAARATLDMSAKSADHDAKAAARLALDNSNLTLDISNKSGEGESNDQSRTSPPSSTQSQLPPNITARLPPTYQTSMPFTTSTQVAERRIGKRSRSEPMQLLEPTILQRSTDGQHLLLLAPGAYSVEGIRSLNNNNDESDNEEGNVSKPFSMGDLSGAFSFDALDASLVMEVSDGEDGNHVESVDLFEEALDVEAIPNPEDKKEEEIQQTRAFSPRHRLMLKGICLVWVLALAIALLANSGGESRERSADRPGRVRGDASQTDVIRYDPYDEEALLASTLRTIKEDMSSPQYKANAWLLQDPSFDQYTSLQKRQRFGLAAKYYATYGDFWFRNDNWLSYNVRVSECDWFGLTCDEQGRVIYQDLSNNNLTGTLVQESQLPYMRRNDRSNNNLHGRFPLIPPGRLELEEFIVSNNHFVGPIVVAAGMTAPDLRIVKLDSNQFEGNIHVALPLFPQLEVWNVTQNKFEGTLPTEVQHTLRLEYLGLGHNLFYGAVPSELGLLTALKALDLSGNPDVKGTLPMVLGSLVSSLEYMDITETYITGEIPLELCQKQNAGELEIKANCSLVQCCD